MYTAAAAVETSSDGVCVLLRITGIRLVRQEEKQKNGQTENESD